MTTQSNHSLIPSKFFSQLCGLIAAGLGMVAIVGWQTGWRILTGIRADYIPMAPNTALSFIVLGVSLYALITERKPALKLSGIGSALILVLSLIRLIELSVNINLNVDRWIFQVPSEKLGLIPVGQMALPTALNFLFASAALFLASSLKRRWSVNALSRVLAGLTTFIGLVFCLGYIYGVPLLYGGTTIPMALNTAISFFVLGLGLVANNVSRDIAERKRVAEALRKAHDELEVRVAERTTELANANEALRAEITERKRAEEALRTSERQLSLVYDNVSDIIFYLGVEPNDQFRFLSVNAAFLKTTGLSESQIMGKLVGEVIPEASLTMVLGKYKEAIRDKKTVRWEETSVYWAGTKHGEVSVTPIFDSEGHCTNLIGAVHDITERKLAEEELHRRNQELSVLHTIDRAVNQTLDLDQILNVAVEKTMEVLDADVGGIYLLQEDGKTMLLVVHRGISDELLKHTERIQLGEGISGHAAAERKPVIMDIAQYPSSRLAPFLVKEGLQSLVSVPLLAKDRALGAINVGSRKPNAFPENKIETLLSIGIQIGVAIQNAELFKAEQRKTAQLLAVNTISQNIAVFMDVEKLFSRVVQLIQEIFGYSYVTLAVVDEKANEIVYTVAAGYDVAELKEPHQKLGAAGIIPSVALSGQSLLTNDVSTEPRFQYCDVLKDTRSELAVPIVVRNKVVAVLDIQSDKLNAFSPDDLSTFKTVAGDIGIAIENARLYEDLRGTTNYLENLITYANAPIIVWNPERKITLFNRAFEKLSGYRGDEVIGCDLEMLFPAAEKEDILETIDQAIKGERWETVEIPIQRNDGERRIALWNSASITDKEGKIIATIAQGQDVTQQKILQQQLLQSQKLESLGTLAGGIAHDFNNILGIMIGHASLLGELPADLTIIKKNTEAIIKAGKRGAALVKQLLTFARKADVVVESVLLNDIVNELSKLLAETFPKTITISLDLEANLPSITADATQLHQVLLNLCVNARDAMPNGGTLTITTRRQSGEITRNRFPKAAMREYIALTVADTGTGMDEATRSRIFEPFFTTKERGKGTGLGLSLVFGIVESHNGFVAVESVPGKGTVFHLCFPVLQQTMELEQGRRKPLERISGGNETILIVEDEEMLTELMKIILEEKGYTVLTASDGDEAVALYTRHQREIRLVLSDLGLPRMNGFEVYRKLKNLNPGIRMILASGYLEPEMKSQILREGARYFIQKPYTPDTILRTIRRVLDVA